MHSKSYLKLYRWTKIELPGIIRVLNITKRARDHLFQAKTNFPCTWCDSVLTDFAISAAKCRRIKAMASPTVSAPKRETDPKKRVVITGMGLVSVFGNDVDTFYNKLLEGESGVTQIDRFDASTYSVRFAGQIRNFSSKGYIDGKNDRRLDDCWRYCLVAGRKALDDATLEPQVLETVSMFMFILQYFSSFTIRSYEAQGMDSQI